MPAPIEKTPRPCPEAALTLRRVRARETDTLSRADRDALHGHISLCGACRNAAVSQDPTLLLAPLAGPAGEAPAAVDGRRMAEDVRAVLESRQFERRVGRASRPFLKVAALLVVGTGLAGLVALHPWGSGTDTAALPAGAGAPAPAAASLASAPLVEEVRSPGAKVYQFAPDAPGQPSVVFVVDRNADL